MTTKMVQILLVEDDEVDIRAIQRSFRDLKIANPLTVVRDGVEAMEALRGENGRPALPEPRLVLLDLNMPRMNGLEFLNAIREDPDLHRLVVFVLTTSASDEDRVRAYERNVAGYVLKNSPGRTFMDAIAMIQHYWKIVEFPEV